MSGSALELHQCTLRMFLRRLGVQMSSTNLEVVFEGPAVHSGTIDARLLAESLIGYSEVFTRANAIINGRDSQAAVLVQSDFKQGSFVAGLEFVQARDRVHDPQRNHVPIARHTPTTSQSRPGR